MSFSFIHKKKTDQKNETPIQNETNPTQKTISPVNVAPQKKGFGFIKKSKVSTDTINNTNSKNNFQNLNNSIQQ